MANITDLVEPGGLFITAALRRCRSYLVGDKRFPSANVDEHDLQRVLARGLQPARGGPRAAGPRGAGLLGRRARGCPAPRRVTLRPARGLRSGVLIASGHAGL